MFRVTPAMILHCMQAILSLYVSPLIIIIINTGGGVNSGAVVHALPCKTALTFASGRVSTSLTLRYSSVIGCWQKQIDHYELSKFCGCN